METVSASGDSIHEQAEHENSEPEARHLARDVIISDSGTSTGTLHDMCGGLHFVTLLIYRWCNKPVRCRV